MRQTIATLLLLFVISPAAGAAMEIRDFEAAHGRYGPKRENLDVYPGEQMLFRYVVTGIKVDATGRIDLELDERLSSADGEMILHAKGTQRERLALGGDSLTGQAEFTLNDRIKPGRYTLTLKATDNLSGESATAERIVTLKAPEFALVMPRFSYDAAGQIPAPAAGMLGQTLHVSVKVLALDASQGKIDSKLDFQIYDDKGKPTMPQPISVTYRQDDPKTAREIDLVRFKADVTLNRVGKFSLKMVVTDRVAGKTATFTSPLVVAAP